MVLLSVLLRATHTWGISWSGCSPVHFSQKSSSSLSLAAYFVCMMCSVCAASHWLFSRNCCRKTQGKERKLYLLFVSPASLYSLPLPQTFLHTLYQNSHQHRPHENLSLSKTTEQCREAVQLFLSLLHKQIFHCNKRKVTLLHGFCCLTIF